MPDTEESLFNETKIVLEKYKMHLEREIAKHAERLPYAVLNHYLQQDKRNGSVFYFTQRMFGTINTDKLTKNTIEFGNACYVFGEYTPLPIFLKPSSTNQSQTESETLNEQSYFYHRQHYNTDYETFKIDCSPQTHPILYTAIIKHHQVNLLLEKLKDNSQSISERTQSLKQETMDKSVRDILQIHRETRYLKFQNQFPTINLPLSFSLPILPQRKSLVDYGIITKIEKLIGFFWKARGHIVLNKIDQLIKKIECLDSRANDKVTSNRRS